MNKPLLFQRALGAAYVVAGIAKFIPAIEDVGQVLATAASANAGTPIAGVSDWLAAHAAGVRVFVALAMLSSGGSQLLNRFLVRAASVGQMAMLVCFSTVIHRSVPQILPVDLAFFAAALFVVIHHTRLLSASEKRAA